MNSGSWSMTHRARQQSMNARRRNKNAIAGQINETADNLDFPIFVDPRYYSEWVYTILNNKESS